MTAHSMPGPRAPYAQMHMHPVPMRPHGPPQPPPHLHNGRFAPTFPPFATQTHPQLHHGGEAGSEMHPQMHQAPAAFGFPTYDHMAGMMLTSPSAPALEVEPEPGAASLTGELQSLSLGERQEHSAPRPPSSTSTHSQLPDSESSPQQRGNVISDHGLPTPLTMPRAATRSPTSDALPIPPVSADAW